MLYISDARSYTKADFCPNLAIPTELVPNIGKSFFAERRGQAFTNVPRKIPSVQSRAYYV